jgi:hypothetical protein
MKTIKLDLTGINHYGNVIRRQVEEEFRDLSLCFIIHRNNERPAAIKKFMSELPTPEIAFDYKKAFKSSAYGNQTEAAGLLLRKEYKLFGLLQNTKAVGIIFINLDDVIFSDTAHGLQFLYHLTWHILALNKKYNTYGYLSQVKRSAFFGVDQNKLVLAKNNLMADVFGAVIMQHQGHQNFIKAVAIKRAGDALSSIIGYEAELFPFPISLELTLIVHQDLIQNLGNRNIKILAQAMQISDEVGITYDNNAIKQWWGFSLPAQKMAWMGEKPEKIMGAAIFTSEDAYVRSIAFLLLEFLKIEPSDVRNFSSYNPYTNDEASQRLHSKACEEAFQKLLSKILEDDGLLDFENEIAKMDHEMAHGQPIGWCSPSLRAAVSAYNDAMNDDKNNQLSPIECARNIFDSVTLDFSWTFVEAMAKNIFKRRRNGENVNLDQIIEFVRQKMNSDAA